MMRSRPQLRTAGLFLTWPQCDVKPETVLARIVCAYQSKLDFAVVSRENHAACKGHEGSEHPGLHLHCVIHLRTGYTNEFNNEYLDTLAGKHGHYEAVRDLWNCLAYVIKDGDYRYHGEEPEALLEQVRRGKKQKISQHAAVERMLCDDSGSVERILETVPGYLLQHSQKIMAFTSFLQQHLAGRDKRAWAPIDTTGLSGNNLVVADWVNANFGDPMPRRRIKQKQLMLLGPANTGKSMFVRWLRLFFKIWDAPSDESFLNGYADQSYDCCVFDEFVGAVPLNTMNSFLEGTPMQVKQKGCFAFKRSNKPCIVLSNLRPMEMYKEANGHSIDAFMSRFDIVYLDVNNMLDCADYASWIDDIQLEIPKLIRNPADAEGPDPDEIDLTLDSEGNDADSDEETDESVTETDILSQASDINLECTEGEVSADRMVHGSEVCKECKKDGYNCICRENCPFCGDLLLVCSCEEMRPLFLPGPEAEEEWDEQKERSLMEYSAMRQKKLQKKLKACKFLDQEAEEKNGSGSEKD